jgi:hypothetical protein
VEEEMTFRKFVFARAESWGKVVARETFTHEKKALFRPLGCRTTRLAYFNAPALLLPLPPPQPAH